MSALHLVIRPDHPEPRKISMAADVLSHGGVALYPTDTVYALGCSLDARKTVDRVYRLKQMDSRQPLAMICADLSDIARYAVVTNFAYRVMRRILPGPYTVVLEATREVPRLLLSKQRTVGIRVPASPICEALVRALGRPLLTSSAVPPGLERACIDAADGKASWPHGLDLTIDGGPTPGENSTVVSLIHDEITVLREGLGAVDGVLK
ncbi:MAG: threonylcarbamoyl-AMP synthase [Deltaproteobacteria bacterium]|nr:threonylcarbamoyl-AMP synthase [Deltaproteobacteria bacterium]